VVDVIRSPEGIESALPPVREGSILINIRIEVRSSLRSSLVGLCLSGVCGNGRGRLLGGYNRRGSRCGQSTRRSRGGLRCSRGGVV
jgi:hypothetical protein